MASKSTVLLTGATSQLGSSILPQLLSSGYTVIVALRSLSKSAPFLQTKYSQHITITTLSFIEIPNMTIPGCFDIPASNSTYIIHVATPLPSRSSNPQNLNLSFEESTILPTWEITHNILLAAKNSHTIERVVICSSLVTVLSLPSDLSEPKLFTAEDYNPITYDEATKSESGAYCYAKTKSEKQAWGFVESEVDLGFDLVTLCAPSILGRSLQEGFVPERASFGGTALIYRNVFDRNPEEGLGFLFPFIMDCEDVARIHVKSLDINAVPGGRYLVCIREKVEVGMVATRIREEFPGLRVRVLDPELEGGKGKEVRCEFDVGGMERVFGVKWKGWWKCVKETVEDILMYEKRGGGDELKV